MCGMYVFQYVLNIILVISLSLLYQEYKNLKADRGQELKQQMPSLKILDENEDTEVRKRTINYHDGKSASPESPTSDYVESSVWCVGHQHTDRLCRFQNLCYIAKNNSGFVFFNGARSVWHGLPKDRFGPGLLDFASVSDHNTHYFNYVDVPTSQAEAVLGEHRWIKTTTLGFHRFHPENLMHVFHDDLLPMFSTLQMIRGLDDIQLFLADTYFEGPYFDLYKSFSSLDPIVASELKVNLCFSEIWVGLLKDTIWYQYGFYEPQGPKLAYSVTGQIIRSFTDYLKSRLEQSPTPPSPMTDAANDYAVLLSRKETRLILNEMELSLSLAQTLKKKVLLVSLDTDSVSDIIHTVSRASVVVGMHGSMMTLSMFLKYGSIVIELFPYGVNPEHYTPYKTLATLPMMGIVYKAWRNADIEHSVTHEDRPPQLGGINHLPSGRRADILNSPQVPRHLCCDDAEWLFRIFQDTHVHVEEIVSLVQEAVRDRAGLPSETTAAASFLRMKNFPAGVRDIRIQCEGEGTGAKVAWSPPWNLDLVPFQTLFYEVWVQQEGHESYKSYFVSLTNIDLSLSDLGEENGKTHVWVRCVIDEVRHGPFHTSPVGVPEHCYL